MQLSELDYQYPEELIATAPSGQFRCCYVNKLGEPKELTAKNELFERFHAGDVLVINESKVLKRRVFSETGLVEWYGHTFGTQCVAGDNLLVSNFCL